MGTLLALAGVAFFAAALAAALVGGLVFRNLSSDGVPSPKTAVIVDQLSLTEPNPAFVDTATKLLEQADYAVDYYSGEEVTVDFYRDLPTRGYDLIILRVHSGLAREEGKPTGYVSLFTGEPFDDTKHYEEGEAKLLGRARYYDGSPEYFSIVPDFIDLSMAGRFPGTTIIVMGCDGLMTDTTAEAFVRKGAEVVIGWNGPVSAAHTDKATERLLQHLVLEEYTAREAIARTMAEVGPDPDYDTVLLMYPA